MGEIADYMIESMLADEYALGHTPTEFSKTCTRCGEQNLFWCAGSVRGWHLIDNKGKRHVCKVDDSEFEDYTK